MCLYVKKRYKGVKYPTVRQLYNWINNEKIDINKLIYEYMIKNDIYMLNLLQLIMD